MILIHEWDGLVERVKQVADAFAAEGYVALAADLYSGRTGANPEENMALVKETLAHPEQLIANLDAAVKYLKSRKDVAGKVATIGWCYGGGVALSLRPRRREPRRHRDLLRPAASTIRKS